jgi:uncharacterized protein YfaS (alpha-2-macroglobulin family)
MTDNKNERKYEDRCKVKFKKKSEEERKYICGREVKKYNIRYLYEKRLKQQQHQQQPFLQEIHVNVKPPHATISFPVG